MVRIVRLAVVLLLLAACGSTRPPAYPGTSYSVNCPATLPAPAPSCPGVAFSGPTMTCSVVTSTLVAGFPRRIEVSIGDYSIFSTLTQAAPFVAGSPCAGTGATARLNITFGLTYVADYGASAPICIARSRVAISQFASGGSIFGPHYDPSIRPTFTDVAHRGIDTAVVETLNGRPLASGESARCPGWVELP
jgi:hypothetical protein